MDYHAFISYSHAADGKLAPALQSGLQRLAKPWFRLPIIKVFRDQTSLSANPGLWSEIERNLGRSKYFILMASEGAACSEWVEREVAWWIANQPIKNLLIVVTDGEIAWDAVANDFDWSKTTCLPPSMKGHFEEEPTWEDLRWAKDRDDLSLRHSQFRSTVLGLAAPLHGIEKHILDSDDIRENRRLQAASWIAGTLIVLLAIGAMITAWTAVENQKKAVANALTALSRQYSVEAQLRLKDGRLGDAFLSALKALRTEDTMEARTALFQIQEAAWNFHAVLRYHQAPVQAVIFRKEGKELLTWSTDNTLVAWDVASRKPLGKPLHAEPVKVSSAAFSPDGQLLVTGTEDGTVIFWDANTLVRLHDFREGENGGVTALAFNTEGTLLALGYQFNGHFVVWDMKHSTIINTTFSQEDKIQNIPISHDSSVTGLSFSKDSRYLAAANLNPGSPVAVWEFPTGKLVAALNYSSSFWVNKSVAFLGQDELGNKANYLVITTSEGVVQLFREIKDSQMRFESINSSSQHQGEVGVVSVEESNFATGGVDGLVSASGVNEQPASPASWSKTPILSLAFSSNSRYLAAGAADGTVMIYNNSPGQPRSLTSFYLDGTRLERSSDGKWIIIHNKENELSESTLSVLNTKTHSVIVEKLSGEAIFSKDSRWLVTKSKNGTEIWDLTVQPPKYRLLLREQQNIYFSPDSSFLVMQTSRGATRVWELNKEPLVEHLLALEPIGYFRAFSPDGKLLLTKIKDEVAVWDLVSRKQIGERIPLGPLKDEDEDDKYRIEFSHDSRWLLTGAYNKCSLHNVSAQPGRAFPVKQFYYPLFSPDGKWLALQSEKGIASLWNLENLKSIFESRENVRMGWQFSTDSRWLAMNSGEGEVQILDLENRLLRRLPSQQKIEQIDLSPNGRWLVTADQSRKAISIWDVEKLETRGSPVSVDIISNPHAFSPDNHLLAVSNDKEIMLVDLPEGRTAAMLHGNSKDIQDLAFSPDGKLLASIDRDGSLILWDPINAGRISEKMFGTGEDEDNFSEVRFDPSGMTLWVDKIPLPANPFMWIADISYRVDPFMTEEEWKQLFGNTPYPWTSTQIKGVDTTTLLN